MKGPLRVLVVEDQDADCELLIREVRKGGYEPVYQRVETPAAMLEALVTQPWDAVVSDWSMPAFNALGALRVLKDKGLDIPFIIVSGTIGEDVAVEALRGGAHDFLLKNRLARLIPALEREIREARMRQERNKMQEQLMISDRMASVGILAAGVAHEINNPLAAVLANIDLAIRDLADVEGDGFNPQILRNVRDELSDARESADRIRSIVRDLKLFSRAENDKRTPIDVRRILESSLRMAWNEIRHRARVVKNYSEVPLVLANESRLGQVALNLIINAAQAIPEGRAETNEIRVATGVDASGRVTFEISDTGAGMPPDTLKWLFTPFFTTKPIGVGTGLGLSICHRIVDNLGGQITVDTAEGKGTTFRVHLPAVQGMAAAPDEAGSAPTAARRRGRILIIDDEPMIVVAVHRTLVAEHDVHGVNSASEALALLSAGERFDVILCDLMMPELTGMDLHKELRRTLPEQADSIIFLTGGAFTSGARQFLDEVPNVRIEKPFDTQALRAIVNDRVK